MAIGNAFVLIPVAPDLDKFAIIWLVLHNTITLLGRSVWILLFGMELRHRKNIPVPYRLIGSTTVMI